MRKLGKTRSHYCLVLGRAKAVGADLCGAVQSGDLAQADFAEMVTRCRGRAKPDRCRDNLARSTSTTIPAFCRNATELAALGAAGPMPEGAK